MKIKERTKKFIEENKTVLIGCGLGVVGGVGILDVIKSVGIDNSMDEVKGVLLIQKK